MNPINAMNALRTANREPMLASSLSPMFAPVFAGGPGFSRAFDELWKAIAEPASRQFSAGGALPAINAWEDDASVTIEAELPGFKPDDIDVSVVAGVLTIRGSRTIDLPDGASPLHRERHAGAFERSFKLAVPVDGDRVEAVMHDGVLRVTLPKSAAALPRRIAVKAVDNAQSFNSSNN